MKKSIYFMLDISFYGLDIVNRNELMDLSMTLMEFIIYHIKNCK
jgi:hypothetical protein